jgi:hypothetical protein
MSVDTSRANNGIALCVWLLSQLTTTSLSIPSSHCRGMVLEMAGQPNEYNTNTFQHYDALLNPDSESCSYSSFSFTLSSFLFSSLLVVLIVFFILFLFFFLPFFVLQLLFYLLRVSA